MVSTLAEVQYAELSSTSLVVHEDCPWA